VILLFSAALNGLLLGLISLQKAEQFFAKRIGNRKAAVIIFFAFFLCAFGVYVGRFLRWNSWDVFTKPLLVANDIADRILNPLDHIKTWTLTTLFGSFLFVFYYSLNNLFLHTKKSV
jgi:uncharacterized membrane protein